MFKLKRGMRGYMKTPYFAAVLLLLAGVFFYGMARMLPAVADETSWEDSIFGPLKGLEQSVYSQTIAAYQDSFLSVARKQQPIIGYMSSGSIYSKGFRALPINPDDYAGDSAIEVVDSGGSQDVYGISDGTPYLRAGTSGYRPVTAEISTSDGTKQSYTFPSEVLMEILSVGPKLEDNNTRYGKQYHLIYTYIDENKTQQTKALNIMNPVTYVLKTNGGYTNNKYTYLMQGDPLDCTTADLDGDGYSELIVAYLSAPDEDIDNNTASSTGRVYVEVYDGRQLFDMKNNDDVPYLSRAQIAEFEFGEQHYGRYAWSPHQVKITKGDFDGDGVMEFPIAFTSRVSFQLALAKYDKESGTINEHISNIQFGDLYQHEGSPERHTTEGMDVTVGDFDGNGTDEIMVVYGKYSGTVKNSPSKEENENHLAFACFKADIANASFTELFNAEDTDVNLWCADITARIFAEAADFDGDGKDELAYVHPGWCDGGDNACAYVSVREWANLDGIGTLLLNDSTQDLLGWHFNTENGWDQAGNHHMALGNFKCTNDNNVKQIALANQGDDSKIDYAVLEAIKDESGWSYKTHGAKHVTDAYFPDENELYTSVAHVNITAADYDHQTMLLGEPETTIITSKIQPIFELHMAPKHYDMIDGASVDVFLQDSSPLPNGYYQTQVSYSSGSTVSTTSTQASEVSQGIDASLSIGGGTTTQPAVIKNTGSASLSAGISASTSQKDSNTSGNKYTSTSTLSGGGQYDDYVSYQKDEVYVYRYPILYPIDEARGTSNVKSDDTFDTGGDITYDASQQFLQIMVPQEPVNWGNGSVAEWYSPAHQPYNLFTYPRKTSELEGYSSAVGYTTSNADVVGKADHYTVSSQIKSLEETTATSSTTNKFSWNAGLSGNISLPGKSQKSQLEGKASVKYTNDKVNSESQVSSSNFTNTVSYTLNWPGRAAFNGVYTSDQLESMEFSAASLMMIENTGNFVMGQLVPSLKSSSSSSLWYANGKYGQKADPALNLPYRYNSGNKVFDEATSDDDSPRMIRGLTIYNGAEEDGDILTEGNTSFRALSAAENYTVKVRVYNCSFVDMKDIKAELYWTNEWTGEDGLTEADKVGTSSLYAIKGWSETGERNMQEIPITWRAGGKLSEVQSAADGLVTGYLHVKVIASGEELHSDNNWAM